MGRRIQSVEHDPEKACPGLDPGWIPVFRKRSCATKDKHDPEKWTPVFRKDHAPPKIKATTIERKAI
jgi:hypothetical protein